MMRLYFFTRNVSEGNKTEVELEVDGCLGSDDEINYLEHVQSFVTLSSTNRGRTEIFLISPNGTTSNLVTERYKDISSEGFNNWPFMSTHHWGEKPHGSWKLMIVCNQCSGNSFHKLQSSKAGLFSTWFKCRNFKKLDVGVSWNLNWSHVKFRKPENPQRQWKQVSN